eukprot:CAMPEP_0202692072 /NCGR_PEP_ID=MMETSP1385-20130828/6555_1 /ASSEMBLY_ACC=CAM_ASM_000861 /TAXON_ID=933848 /ORGANISM="Elphidium margaritaceum" /LENGTH=762 /DNA_ID=CAMNT_0049347545 /DNA_START=24 /DNA_END=2309 /DNA_ORIENTATION=+
MLNLEHRHSLLTSQRRRDSGISVGSLTSNVSRFSYLSTCQGGGGGGKSPFCVTITLEVDSMRYLKSSDEYDVRLSDVSVLSLDVIKKQLRCKIAASKIKHVADDHDKAEIDDADDDYISSMLDDVDADRDDHDTTTTTTTIRNSSHNVFDRDADQKHHETAAEVDTAEQARDPIQEWSEIAPKKSIHKYRSCSIGDCDHIERLIFVLKYYAIYIKQQQRHTSSSSSSRYVSMTTFLSTLRNYDRVKLLNDYYHTKKYHLSNESDKELVEYVAAKLVHHTCTDTHSCACCHRMTSTPQYTEIYRTLSTQQRRDLYWISDNTNTSTTTQEMAEIALLSYLDMIHVLLLHYGFSSSGDKFVTQVSDAYMGDADAIFGHGADDDDDCRYNYWQQQQQQQQQNAHAHVRTQFVAPSHKDLKSELLQNDIYALNSDDYALLELKCVDYQQSEIGTSLQCKREFAWMANRVKCGEFMSLEHIMCVMIATNYTPLMQKFKHMALAAGGACGANVANDANVANHKHDQKHQQHQMSQIANFLRLLKESVWCFGDVLSDKQRLYHGLNEKLLFSKCNIAFEVPVSLTAKYSMAQKLDKHHMILKMGKMLHHTLQQEQNVLHFDVSNFSAFPVEKERIVFGANLGLVDVIYDGASHLESIMSLTLYQQIMAGQWFYRSKNSVYFKKKYQRKIVKFIRTMIRQSTMDDDVDEDEDDDDDDDDVLTMAPVLMVTKKKKKCKRSKTQQQQQKNYIQQLFESITMASKYDARRRVIW